MNGKGFLMEQIQEFSTPKVQELPPKTPKDIEEMSMFSFVDEGNLFTLKSMVHHKLIGLSQI